MFIDKQNLFSDDQAITATAVSTNVIDLGAVSAFVHASGTGAAPTPNLKDAELLVQVTEAFTSCTNTVQVFLCHDTVEACSSAQTAFESRAVPASELVAGYQFRLPCLPQGLNRYLKLNYVVSGTYILAGKVLAGLIIDRQSQQ